jgi:hypothetical protein
MFELILLASTTSGDGTSLIITDGSDWGLAAFPRTAFGVHVKGEFRVAAAPTAVSIATYDPLDAVTWTASTPVNGRYSFTAYAFLEKDTEAPAEGDVHIDVTDGLLYQWISAAWVSITLDAAIAAGKAYVTSTVLDVPFLAYAYAYKNVLNLEYIKLVKNDISKGAQQNKMYYRRTDLDYFSSVVSGAEYNWALGLYSNYYEIVNNINAIISSGIIS